MNICPRRGAALPPRGGSARSTPSCGVALSVLRPIDAMASDASETQALAAAAAAPDRASTADVPMAVGGERQPADALAHLNALPAWLQWVLSLVLLAGMVAWLLLGNVAAGTIGAADCPLDAWLVPVVAGVIAGRSAVSQRCSTAPSVGHDFVCILPRSRAVLPLMR